MRADRIEAAFCAECSDEVRALVRERVRPEPTAALGTPIARSEASVGRVPRRYVRTTADRAVSTALQDRMLAATPTPTVSIDSGHLPALEATVELVDAILAAP